MDAEQLRASSQRWMTTGLDAFLAGESSLDFAVHHHGVALEHLLKAYLASLHPALIVEAKDFDAMLHATGHGARARRPNTRSKTIGLNEAFGRARKLLPKEIIVTDSQFEPVLAARNGVAHSGYHEPAEVREVLTMCMRIADTLLVAMGESVDEYWGDYSRLHRELIEEHVSEIRVAVLAKVARAKAVYRGRVGGLETQHHTQIMASLTSTAVRPRNYGEYTDCPACEARGWLHGSMGLMGFKWNNEESERISSEPPKIVMYSHAFECYVCGLNLEGDELEAAGLPSEIIVASGYPSMSEFFDQYPD
jgi:hypothetical protein